MGVVQVIAPGGLVGAGDELDLGIIRSHLQHEGFEAEGVVDDEVAAVVGQLDVGVLAAGVLGDVPLDHPLHVDALGRQGLGGGLLAADEVVGIALVVLVADADQAHLHGLGLGGVAAGLIASGLGTAAAGRRGGVASAASAGGQTQNHHQGQQDCKKLLHSGFPPYKRSIRKGTG